ncbi:MAG: sugar ABC transporter permease [Ruminococcaceae bacterium]|nr:sugar ABC transporter permease [Oscillospiraceae bacterium]
MILFLFFIIAGIILINFYPFIYCLVVSLLKSNFDYSFVGLDNYVSSFENEFFILAIKNSVCFTVISTILLIIFSFLIGSLMTVVEHKIKKLLFVAIFLPVLVPYVSSALVFMNGFTSDISAITLFDQTGYDLIIGSIIIYLYYIWKHLGLGALFFWLNIGNINKSMLEAAKMDGCGKIRLLINMILPLSRPAFLSVSVLGFSYSFKISSEIILWFGNYPPENFYLLQHYVNNSFIKLNYQSMSVAMVVFDICILCLTFLFFFLLKKSLYKEEFGGYLQ